MTVAIGCLLACGGIALMVNALPSGGLSRAVLRALMAAIALSLGITIRALIS